jgi:hypothetical protein
LYYYIRSNGNGLALFENIFEIISQLGFETNLISAFMAGVKSVKLINSIRNEIIRIKDKNDIVSEIDKFIEKVDCSSKIYEEDIYTKIIKDNINYFKNAFNKKIVLVVEDMDRLDPAHLFRIMNVFSAHLDYCYNYGGKEQNLCDNKFNFDNIVFVLDYENTKKIYEHFYGVSTDFEGYIHKFSSKGYYKYSLKEIKEEYMSRIYSLLSDTTDMEIELIKELVPAKAIEENTIRKIEQACHNVDSQIYSQKKIVFNEKEYTLHLGILRLLVILVRLGCSKDEIIEPMLNVCKTNFSDYSKSKVAKLFFSYSLGYLYIVDNMELSNVFYYNYSVREYFRGVKILDINNGLPFSSISTESIVHKLTVSSENLLSILCSIPACNNILDTYDSSASLHKRKFILRLLDIFIIRSLLSSVISNESSNLVCIISLYSSSFAASIIILF